MLAGVRTERTMVEQIKRFSIPCPILMEKANMILIIVRGKNRMEINPPEKTNVTRAHTRFDTVLDLEVCRKCLFLR